MNNFSVRQAETYFSLLFSIPDSLTTRLCVDFQLFSSVLGCVLLALKNLFWFLIKWQRMTWNFLPCSCHQIKTASRYSLKWQFKKKYFIKIPWVVSLLVIRNNCPVRFNESCKQIRLMSCYCLDLVNDMTRISGPQHRWSSHSVAFTFLPKNS